MRLGRSKAAAGNPPEASYDVRSNKSGACNGRELLKKRRIFDLAYDSGAPASADIVAAEAKGRLRGFATRNAVRKSAEDGYRMQVQPLLGQTLGGGQVAHGYSVGTGSQLKKGVACHMHVEETGLPGAAGQSGSISSPPAGVVARQANGTVVMGNFRGRHKPFGWRRHSGGD